ncbi:hypothetical protein HRI_004107100 [Hibiscus trionum]|uniref:hAT-like transposase RNase-H fold domain-containing protein n=1 Tax=Hibiscus trionum TaxID=183268 RepID=A0A9W7J2V7_HIBTR|nr:hypothetical protein HRI_004107100 [Hibiscus trionum]
MTSSMIVKFDKYWKDINVILSMASVLDPRRKLECLSLYFSILFGDDDEFEFECDKVRKVLIELVDDYGKKVVDKEFSLVSPSLFANDQGKRTLIDSDDVEELWEKHVLQQPLKGLVSVKLRHT